MTKTKAAIYAAVISGGLLYLWSAKRKSDSRKDTAIMSTALPKNDIERIIVSPNRHEIETVVDGPHGRPQIKKTFVPSSGASVDIRRDGSVQVTSRTWGTSLNPYVGVALGSDIVGRAAVGLDVFYWQRWELGGGLLVDSNIRDTRVFAAVNYNVYGNILIGGAVDNRHMVHIVAALKF